MLELRGTGLTKYEKGLYPELTLWRMVIVQALIDLDSKGTTKMDKINRVKSILYCNSKKEGFKTVCAIADVDPSRVSNLVQKIKTHNPYIKVLHG